MSKLVALLRHLSSVLPASSPDKRTPPPTTPSLPLDSAHQISASYVPSSGENISLGHMSQGSSSSGHRLELNTRRATQERSWSSDESPFSPSATFVASPLPSEPAPFSKADGTNTTSLNPTTPWRNNRYEKREPVSVEPSKIPAGPLAVHRGRQRSLETDWQEYTHPEGQCYSVNTAHPIHIVTQAHIRDPTILRIVNEFSDLVLKRVASNYWHLHSTELLVDLDDEEQICSYYFVDHEDMAIFWLDETDTEDLDFPDVSGPDHLKTLLRELYWLHGEYFPVHRDLPANSDHDLVATLTHSCIDVTTATTSTSSFDRSQLETMLSAMKSIKNSPGSAGQRNCIVARLWNDIYHTRFINFHGERHARLFRTQIVVQDEPSSMLMKIIFIMLFDAPSTHLTTLQDLYIDEVLYSDNWKKFMEALVNDWQDLIFWTTVLLAANMSFLAIFNSPEDVMMENRAVTCSVVSTLCSTVSIVIGLLHVRKHRPRARTHATDGNEYLQNAKHPRLGLRPLAIVYSLPYAFLMWAMVTFIAAILLFTFQSGITKTSRFLIGVIALCLGGTLLWAISYFWKDELRLVDDFRNLRKGLRSLSSAVRLNRMVGTVTTRAHNPAAANTPIVRHWARMFAAAARESGERSEGV